MTGGKQLLLLAVSVLLVKCQQRPKVSMSPSLKQIFSGDAFYLSCENSTGGSSVKWYFDNNVVQTLTNKTWKIASAAPDQSGSYQCESNGQKSQTFSIKILEYLPKASLTIKTGEPVMRPDSSVVLQLDNEDGLQGWNCFVFREPETRRIKLKLQNDSGQSFVFQPRSLSVLETIFWCSDGTRERRSNQITVRTSGKDVSLQMYPQPTVAGESLVMKCLVWGTDQITYTVFYKDDAVIQESVRPTYQIPNVTDSTKGRYKCHALYTYEARTAGPLYQMESENQDVFVQVVSMKASLTRSAGLSCGCPLCPPDASYRWYNMNADGDSGQPLALKDSSQGNMTPKDSGTYACRAVWRTGRSQLSNRYAYEPPISSVVIVVIVLLLLLIAVAAAAFCMWYKKRDATGPIYEDVRMERKGESTYEMPQRSRGGEYDTIHPGTEDRRLKGGEYERLKKDKGADGVYHFLGMEGAAAGAGGYEALQKGKVKEEAYHTLGMEGAGAGAGGYEALQKGKVKEEEYHTLGMEGAGAGAGGYEALQRDKIKEEAYHTLGMEGAGGGE